MADTGLGIPPEYLPHVFEKFFRVPGQSQGGGTGLGLAIVREIVTAHGGTITCDSQPGAGTMFRLTLPIWTGKPPSDGFEVYGTLTARPSCERRNAVSTDAARPAPEHFLTLIRQQQRGRLKVYLGFAAGVGKTYEMLQEGHRLKRQGVDVVIGIVETHGRAETAALIGDLEQVPRRAHRVPRRGPGRDGPGRPARPPTPRWPWWTSWPTPMPPAAAMPSATRTSRNCCGPASTSSPR